MGSITSKNKKQKSDEYLSSHIEEQQYSEQISPTKRRKVDDKVSNLKSRTEWNLGQNLQEGFNFEPSFIFTRKGSMYFDEEGSVAHEFYEEIRPDEPGAKPYMKRQLNNLTPQGEVSYNYPRLSGDCDIIICDP